ncbi:hypothetical protein [Tropicimonas sp. IMCC34011]|uniref:hypothetical protein n=1 Tax=Tropicimonas sp. IMCC34011 TaxID=2248759 RepID=UPI00130098AA|nr:hypothetical protein [Tropicimonas sp. IMCC34011]
MRNPKFSQARYRLGKAVKAPALKKAFAVYDIRNTAAAKGRKISNWYVAKLARLDYCQRERADEVPLDEVEQRRVVSAIVARHVKDANKMINNATVGIFP